MHFWMLGAQILLVKQGATECYQAFQFDICFVSVR